MEDLRIFGEGGEEEVVGYGGEGCVRLLRVVEEFVKD